MSDLIDRQQAIDGINKLMEIHFDRQVVLKKARDVVEQLPPAQPAQPERDIPRRVMWTGWKGHRYTRYNCPNCKKPVRNDDVYCHRCGQRLMFPKVSHTPYVEGQKQEVIVRWEDEVTK